VHDKAAAHFNHELKQPLDGVSINIWNETKRTGFVAFETADLTLPTFTCGHRYGRSYVRSRQHTERALTLNWSHCDNMTHTHQQFFSVSGILDITEFSIPLKLPDVSPSFYFLTLPALTKTVKAIIPLTGTRTWSWRASLYRVARSRLTHFNLWLFEMCQSAPRHPVLRYVQCLTLGRSTFQHYNVSP
jgi:hypothetical protein